MNGMKIQEIKVKDLEVDRYNARRGEWIHDQELVDSIKQMGILEPLLVRKLKKGYGIVCGSRRWNASISAKLKTVPCVVREFTDLEALGTSLQENLQRGNLDSVQESEAIADLWELMNGKKPYAEKIKTLKKQFGFSERTINDYLAISRLSNTIKELLHRGAVDKQTAATISNEEEWDEEEKEEAAEILSRVDSAEKRRKIVSEMKRDAVEFTPAESYEKHKVIERIRHYGWTPRHIWVNKAMDKASKKWDLDYQGIIEKCLTSTSHIKKFK